jgi:hypothetical protein
LTWGFTPSFLLSCTAFGVGSAGRGFVAGSPGLPEQTGLMYDGVLLKRQGSVITVFVCYKISARCLGVYERQLKLGVAYIWWERQGSFCRSHSYLRAVHYEP